MPALSPLKLAAALLLACALGLPAPAAAQAARGEVLRAQVTQLYLNAEAGLSDLFAAERAFARARAAEDRASMRAAAAEMFAGGAEAAYWSVVLDQRVRELGARPEILELTGELRAISVAIYGRMSDIVSTNDMAELGRRLDDSADGLTRLRAVMGRIYDVIRANVRGE
jgi:hypothetical protein